MISELSDVEGITPIIICGAARSGTRMITDILNSHPEVAIQNEMHAGTVEAYFEMIDVVTRTYAHHSERKGKFLGDLWEKSRKGLTHAFLASACKKGPVGKGKDNLKYHGIKTPGFERYFDQFENAFSGVPPKYVYCARAPEKVWPSWVALGYLNDVEVFRRRYLRSLRQANKIKIKAPDRFSVFDLDAFVSSADKTEFLHDNIFSMIGILDSKAYSSEFLALPNRNSLERTGKPPVSSHRLESEMAMLRNCELIKEQRSKLGLVL